MLLDVATVVKAAETNFDETSRNHRPALCPEPLPFVLSRAVQTIRGVITDIDCALPFPLSLLLACRESVFCSRSLTH